VEQQRGEITRPWFIITVMWFSLFIVALTLDAPVATWVHDHGIDVALKDNMLVSLWKFPGNFAFTVLIVMVALAIGKMDLRDAGFVVLCGFMAVADVITKWVIGRTRPYKLDPMDHAMPFTLHPFRGGIMGFFSQKDLSFPSGHEWSAFALAMAIALIRPKWSWIFFMIAFAVGAERVLENAHFISDVFAAMPAAVIGCIVAYRLVRPNEFPGRPA
jgi:membrane-associated phospholipid phosphatase